MNLRRFRSTALFSLALLLPIAARAAAPTDSRIVGKWRAMNEAVFELKPDGTGRNASGAFRYAASEGVLVFTAAEGSWRTAYQLDANKLVVTAESSGGSSATSRTPNAPANASACNGVTMRRAPATCHSCVRPRAYTSAPATTTGRKVCSAIVSARFG